MLPIMETAHKATPQERMKKARDAARMNGKSPTARGKEKMNTALYWVYRWGSASPTMIDLVGGAQGRGLAARLVRQGLLTRTRTESGGGLANIPAAILTLTELGLQEAERRSDELLAYELDPYKVRQVQLRHDYLAQWYTLLALQGGKITDFLTERQLAHRSAANLKQPDVVWLNEGRRTAIEIELSAKWGRELDQFVYASILSLLNKQDKPRMFDSLGIFSDSPAILRRYQAAFAPGATFRTWGKDEQRRWVVDEELCVPDWMGEPGRVFYVEIPDD
jgi:hypothetical protein